MQTHQCGFPNCSQQFANQYDLIAHIEYTHIPVIEDDVKRKRMIQESSDRPVTPNLNLPLSYYSRVFRTAYRPNPIKPEPLKVSFNHYKRRAQKEKMQSNIFAARILREMMAKQGRHISLDDSEKKAMEIDFNECGPDDPEVRFQCAIVDCNKRYKSMFALRVHMKISHNVVVSEEAKSLTNYASEDVKPNLSLLQQSMQQMSSDRNATSLPTSDPGTPLSQGSPRPGGTPNFGNPATNQTSMKCSCCNKRYKTPGGLSNHMMQTHQKISDVQDVPSQMVVEQLISQVRMQRHQQEQSSSESSSQKNLPISSTSQTVANFLKSMSRSRTFSVSSQQSNRFSQQHYPVNLDNQPSTGQVLQMQMQHQKRLKQMQEMKNIQEQQAAQAGALQHTGVGMQQVGQPVGQSVVSSSTPQQQMGQLQQPYQTVQAQQPHNQMPAQKPQQHSPYPQQMQQVTQHSPHPYQQYPQQSPQFPQYQEAPPAPAPQQHQQQPGPAQPQRSPAPMSQSLPPLSSVTHQHRPSMPQQAQPNSSGPIQFSPPNSQDFNTVSSPPSNQQTPSQHPPLYNQ